MARIGFRVMVGRPEMSPVIGPCTELRAREGVHRSRDRTVAICEKKVARGGDQPTCQRAEGGPDHGNDCRSDRCAELGVHRD